LRAITLFVERGRQRQPRTCRNGFRRPGSKYRSSSSFFEPIRIAFVLFLRRWECVLCPQKTSVTVRSTISFATVVKLANKWRQFALFADPEILIEGGAFCAPQALAACRWHPGCASIGHARPHPPPISRTPRLLAHLFRRRSRWHDRARVRPILRMPMPSALSSRMRASMAGFTGRRPSLVPFACALARPALASI
jgi:hypothetical protein